jgi:EmrB/QacA subfamily drug resistance transporter
MDSLIDPPLPVETGRGPTDRRVALLVACALFMQNLDGTVIATALPAMGRAFHEDPVRLNVALTAYLFAAALFIPASGWAADRFGTRRVFRTAIAVFTLGSVLCGIAGSLPVLVAARIVQGAGGAMMLPVGRLVLLRSVPKERLVSAMAFVSIPALIGPVLGPPLGGLIVTAASWRWIFFLNVPIGLAGALAATVWIADFRSDDPGRFDLPGLALAGAAFACLMGLLELAGRGIASPALLAALALATLATAALYWRRARTQPRPALDLRLMRLPTFAVSVMAGSLFRFGVGAQPFLLPLLIQLGFGRSALQSGLITFAAAAGAIAAKPLTQVTLRRFGFRTVLVLNGALSGALIAVSAAFRPAWPLAAIYAVLLAAGALRSLQFTAYNAIAYAEVPNDRMSAATTLYSALQQVSLTVGIPIAAAILHAARLAGGHATPTPSDFSFAFLVLGGVSMLAGPASLVLPRGAGHELHPAE